MISETFHDRIDILPKREFPPEDGNGLLMKGLTHKSERQDGISSQFSLVIALEEAMDVENRRSVIVVGCLFKVIFPVVITWDFVGFLDNVEDDFGYVQARVHLTGARAGSVRALH